MNNKTQFSNPEIFHPAASVDYYDNLCDVISNLMNSYKREQSTLLTINDLKLETIPNEDETISINEEFETKKKRVKPIFDQTKNIEKKKG